VTRPMIAKMQLAHNFENQDQCDQGEVIYRVPLLGQRVACLKQAIPGKITADKRRGASCDQKLQEFQNLKGSQAKATA